MVHQKSLLFLFLQLALQLVLLLAPLLAPQQAIQLVVLEQVQVLVVQQELVWAVVQVEVQAVGRVEVLAMVQVYWKELKADVKPQSHVQGKGKARQAKAFKIVSSHEQNGKSNATTL